MKTSPFAINDIAIEPGSLEWMIIEANRLGFVYADNRFLSWVDTRLGREVGDLIRPRIVHTSEWVVRNGLPITKIRLDDLISYSFIGIDRNTKVRSAEGSILRVVDFIKNSGSFIHWFSSRKGDAGSFDPFYAQNSTSELTDINTPLLSAQSAGADDWFDGSQIADTNGKPIVVYHGTTSDFDTFMPSEGDGNHLHGIYFSRESERNGSNYSADYYIDNDRGGYLSGGRIIPVHLNIKNLASSQDEDIARRELGDSATSLEVTNLLKKKGFDGYADSNEIIAFDSNQVRFALGNNAGPKNVLQTNANRVKNETFQQWFDKSKIVDAEGKPLVVYHGTGAEFTIFNDASYFSADPDIASNTAIEVSYANDQDARVLPVYLSIQNPAVLSGDEIEGLGYSRWEIERLRQQGFDGAMNPEMTEILAFDSDQIRSAIGNKADFDFASRSSLSSINEIEIDDWFEESKIVDDMVNPLTVYHGSSVPVDAFNYSEQGIYFTKSLSVASAYAIGYDNIEITSANISAVHLSIKNPLIVTDDWLNAFSVNAPSDPMRRGHAFRDDFVDSEKYAREAVITEAKRLGHDGMVLTNDLLPIEHMGGDWDEQPSFVAFDPSQIRLLPNENVFDKQIGVEKSDASGSSLTIGPTDIDDDLMTWMEDSKVLVNGEPLIVYHGTKQVFDEFNMDQASDGAHWFVADIDHAKHFGEVKAYCLAIGNPMEITQDDLELAWDDEHPEGEPDGRDLLPRDFVSDFVQTAKDRGHDGLIIRGMADLNTTQDMYLAFDAKQIRHMGGDDYKLPFKTPSEATEEDSGDVIGSWMEKSKVVDSNGLPLMVYHGTKKAFSEFKTPAWFTPSKYHADMFSADWGADGARDENSRVISAYLKMENPIVTNDWNVTEGLAFDEDWIRERTREGFDGVIFTSDEGEVEYIVFSPDQIKVFDDGNHNNHMAKPLSVGVAVPLLTDNSLLLEVGRKFPRLISAAESILEKGRSGREGGAIVISTDKEHEIAELVAERTGFSEDVALQRIHGEGKINGFYEANTRLTFIVGNNMTPEKGVSVLFHELSNSQQLDRAGHAAMSLIKNRDNEDSATKGFLDRVYKRMSEVGGSVNKKEAMAYVIEQAVVEFMIRASEEKYEITDEYTY